MAPNLSPGGFRIVSLIEGNPPAGVNLTLLGLQFVYLNAPVTVWAARKGGDNVYQLAIGGYPFTGVIEGKVTAFINPEGSVEWHATYHKLQDAYTIEPIDDRSKGWTVADDSPNAAIEIRPIISTRSLPPQFLPTQLFRFEPVDE